tara:strand:+ start:29442 stop:30233 length:792 start_codon:yes stop_codon:yes gene_type:complete
MIKFFRHIRQSLISENKFSKYILYAFGEIILVVIGILIALQINNWNETRMERSNEQKILKQLHKEYTQNLKQLDEKISMRIKMTQASNALLNYIDNPKEIEDDSLLYCLFRLSQDPTFDPLENDIIATGKLRLITNDSISEMLSNWTSDIQQVQEIEDNWQLFRNDYYYPVLINENLIRNVGAYVLNSGYSPDHALDKNDTISFFIRKNNVDLSSVIIKNATEIQGVASTCIIYNSIINVQAYALRKRIVRLLNLINRELKDD